MFYKEELVHIIISVLTISLAFSLPTLAPFPLVFFTVGVGFVLHELAHKFVAIRFGCMAVYKAWIFGLVLAIGMALATGGRFIFAAPGAVYIFKPGITKKEDGMISFAGPFTNLLLGFGFLWLATLGMGFRDVAGIGYRVNMFLGLFNMIPFYPLDGSKVFAWSAGAWAMLAAVFVVFNFVLVPGF